MKIAQETVDYINNGGYLENKFSKDIFMTRLYNPKELKELSVGIIDSLPNAKISLYNEDTCECAKRFIDSGYTCILNFASAKHVGGGFLSGAMAQEEAICRNSTLYASINSKVAEEYYNYNNSHDDELYSDYTIFSPHVEVIRDANSNLLEKPYTISVITSPAVNVYRARNTSRVDIAEAMLQRAEYILKVAISNHVDNIVLGAWGCGVFGNSPKDISRIFYYLLIDKGYAKAFKNVSFAVYGRDPENFQAFKDTFADFL
jgi:uncharacterized protein (TIGR02452 family)